MTGSIRRRMARAVLGIAGLAGGMGCLAVPEVALADDDTWGCEVALCLATPGSPMTYAECVPPITKLYQAMALGGGLPTCTAGGMSFSRVGTLPIYRVAQADGSASYYYVYADSNGNVAVATMTQQQVESIW